MAHLALVAPPLRGHLDPMAALGHELVRRGHRVTLLTDGEPATGLPMIDLQAGGLDPARSRPPGVLAAVRGMAHRCEALCEVLPGELQSLGANAVVCDQTEPGGALAAKRCGLPYASLAAALPLNREPGLPPPYVNWTFRDGPGRRWLYQGGHRVVDWLMRPLNDVIRRRAADWNIGGVTNLDDTFSPELQLLQLPLGLDFPQSGARTALHQVGPLRDPDPGRFEPDDEGRPLAFCSLGTLQGFRADLFRSFAEQLDRLGFRPVIAHGGRLPPDAAATLPGNPIVADFLPQRAVLARSRLAVLHGGMNSVLDALAAGVPMIVTPLAYEQGAIAARVAASGAGLALKPSQVKQGLAVACQRLTSEPGFAAAAGRLAAEIRASGGVTEAARLVEAMIAGRR
jgi:zeaxanthin glucosyltransferase